MRNPVYMYSTLHPLFEKIFSARATSALVERFFYRATACNATHGIAVGILFVRLSVCLSVCPSDACIVTKLNDALRIF